MSTTKLPEAFERKGFDDAPVQHDNSHSYVWADGYNACLEATGAKELWEALDKISNHRPPMMAIDEYRRGYSDALSDMKAHIDAALSKSNPSNTVG